MLRILRYTVRVHCIKGSADMRRCPMSYVDVFDATLLAIMRCLNMQDRVVRTDPQDRLQVSDQHPLADHGIWPWIVREARCASSGCLITVFSTKRSKRASNSMSSQTHHCRQAGSADNIGIQDTRRKASERTSLQRFTARHLHGWRVGEVWRWPGTSSNYLYTLNAPICL